MVMVEVLWVLSCLPNLQLLQTARSFSLEKQPATPCQASNLLCRSSSVPRNHFISFRMYGVGSGLDQKVWDTCLLLLKMILPFVCDMKLWESALFLPKSGSRNIHNIHPLLGITCGRRRWLQNWSSQAMDVLNHNWKRKQSIYKVRRCTKPRIFPNVQNTAARYSLLS